MRVRAGLLALAALAGCATAPPVAPPAALLPEDPAAFFDCLRERGLAVVSAHRGGPGPGWAENAVETLAALAREAPVLFEVDVRRTADGELVLLHDETLERTTSGAGPVAQATLAEVQSLGLEDPAGAPAPGRTPSLRQALDAAAPLGLLQLDIKRGTPFADVVAAVREAGAEQRVIVIVYSLEDAAAVHALAPTVMLSVSVRRVEDVAALEAAGIDLSRVLAFTGTELPDARLYAALAARGIEVIFGTLGPAARSWDGRFAATAGDAGYTAFARAGVQVIATDRPREAYAALDAADGPGFPVAQCLGARG